MVEGRRFSGQFRVRLGDADESGVLRLDGVARVLQDVATDDWEETGLESTRYLGRSPHGDPGGRRGPLAALQRGAHGDDVVWRRRCGVGRTPHEYLVRRASCWSRRSPMGAGGPDGPSRSNQTDFLRRLRRSPTGTKSVRSRAGTGRGRRCATVRLAASPRGPRHRGSREQRRGVAGGDRGRHHTGLVR